MLKARVKVVIERSLVLFLSLTGLGHYVFSCLSTML